jgi:hypothetical protein
MSTLRLLKNSDKHGKKGDVVTVPFLEAKKLVASGIAERPGQAAEAAPPAVPTVPKVDHDAALKKIADLEAEVADMKELLAAADAKGKDKPPAK